MEEKESTISGSLGNSDTDSPPAPVSNLQVLPQVMNINNMSSETATTMTSTVIPRPGGRTLSDSLGKKKRGRPRKYDADGNLRVPYQIVTTTMNSPPGFTLSPSSPTEFSSHKRGKGRSPGNWQLLASLGELFAHTAGGDFTAHVVKVNTGEGRFEILSLTGSFTFTDNGGVKSRTGGLSVSLAGSDGRVIGGGLAGVLLAASPIQIVVGSFMLNGYKVHKRKPCREQHTVAASAVTTAPSAMAITEEGRPIISQAKLDCENNVKPTSPFQVGSLGEATASIVSGWNNGSEPASIHRPSPDINVSVPSE
ncbi:hypothetical protein GOBAR_AA09156 [Gossypium barbadense]|uniref:AT-hook motif nuclear-localized protein n=1 Tax=Gossypium barbadense TaxID=3634 RepID=A0A2P5Y7C9_GOSBA|nr:hypothetical protein GOBAR_AA09156 [Gossypium barbadense]